MISNKKKLIILLTMLTMISFLSYGISYAKYATSSLWNYFLESKGFYFDSHALEYKTVNNTWDGGKVEFDVRNSINSYVATEYDIKYEVTCKIKSNIDARCTINGTESDTFNGTLTSYEGCINLKDDTDVSSYNKETCNEAGYSYRVKETVVTNYFEVFSNDDTEINNVTVEITVKSTSPYIKTLQNEFILGRGLTETGLVNHTYHEYDEYSRLVISNTYSEDKCIKLSWDNTKLRIDNSDDYTYGNDNSDYVNYVLFNIKSKTSLNHIFYRMDKTKNYTNDDFILEESNECK